MPPRLRAPFINSFKRLKLESSTKVPVRLRPAGDCSYSDSTGQGSSQGAKGPNQDVLPHVSEEAAATSKITGEQAPELEKGTPVEDVLKRDPEAKEKAPKVIKQEINPGGAPKGSRSYSTLQQISTQDLAPVIPEGFKFEPPQLPLPPFSNHTERYDPLIDQMTNEMMKDGKKAKAQRYMTHILTQLRTSPAPNVDPRRPLLSETTHLEDLPRHPVKYLTLVIDSIAPLMRIRPLKGAAGGGQSLDLPVPLNLRQRRRKAIKWILEAAERRPWRGSGKMGFPQRVADEIIAVAEGRSSAWDRRHDVHKLGVAARANLNLRRGRRRIMLW